MSALQTLCGGRLPAAMLFDLDGTLIDSVPDLAVAVDFMLTRQQFAAAGEDKVRNWVGNGALRLVQRALADALELEESALDQQLVDDSLQHFFGAYAADCCRHTTVYAGVIEALEHWQSQGIAMACVTNKPMRFTLPILAHYGLERFMPVTVAGDSLDVKKPDPLPLFHACEQLDVAAERTVMVGDSHNDIRAAKAAGMASVAVSYGYNHGAPIAVESPGIIVDSLAELL